MLYSRCSNVTEKIQISQNYHSPRWVVRPTSRRLPRPGRNQEDCCAPRTRTLQYVNGEMNVTKRGPVDVVHRKWKNLFKLGCMTGEQFSLQHCRGVGLIPRSLTCMMYVRLSAWKITATHPRAQTKVKAVRLSAGRSWPSPWFGHCGVQPWPW